MWKNHSERGRSTQNPSLVLRRINWKNCSGLNCLSPVFDAPVNRSHLCPSHPSQHTQSPHSLLRLLGWRPHSAAPTYSWFGNEKQPDQVDSGWKQSAAVQNIKTLVRTGWDTAAGFACPCWDHPPPLFFLFKLGLVFEMNVFDQAGSRNQTLPDTDKVKSNSGSSSC